MAGKGMTCSALEKDAVNIVTKEEFLMSLTDQPAVITLWPVGAPGSEAWLQREQETYLPSPYDVKVVRNIAQPTLTAYLPAPAVANGTAVIICPGGAFHFLSIESEGTEVAHWLCTRGVAAFVLKYRVLQTEAYDEDFVKQMREIFLNREKLGERMKQAEPLAIADGKQAIKVVRKRAAEWGIVADQIGMLGFSAGGAVTVGAALQYDEESRPNFVAPIYTAPFGTAMAVPADAPSLFMVLASDDPLVAEASLPLYSAWRGAGHLAELHIYAQGGHGFGMKKQGLPSDHWIDRFADWLQSQGDL
jgi:acetyl esterase/lipase